ncbi:MAG: formyltransferase family protein [Candidatus Levybacteria bacterium]|nr:formyltransferase family protein [Candidatus Levybacteria bacterium]
MAGTESFSTTLPQPLESSQQQPSYEYLDYRIDEFDVDPNTQFQPLNIVVVGKGQLAEGYLKAVTEAGHNVISVFGPAKQENDKDFDMVRKTAKEMGVPDYMFSKLTDEKVVEELKNAKPDLIIGASLTAILPDEVAELALLGAYGWHPSLLPEYRGATAVAWQILNEEEEFGMSLNAFGRDDESKVPNQPVKRNKPLPIGSVENDEKDTLDKGPILARRVVPRNHEYPTTSATFPNVLFPAGIEFLVEVTNKMAIAKDMGLIFRGEPQIDGTGSYQPIMEKVAHAKVDPIEPAHRGKAIIDAASNNPGAWLYDENGKMISLYGASVVEGDPQKPGMLSQIVELEEGKGYLLIGTGQDLLAITTLRTGEIIEGKEKKGKLTSAPQFAADNNIVVGHTFT